MLRDEGEAFGRKLDAAGVPVTVTRYNGMIHDYGLLNALSQEPTVRTAINQAGEELRLHLKCWFQAVSLKESVRKRRAVPLVEYQERTEQNPGR